MNTETHIRCGYSVGAALCGRSRLFCKAAGIRRAATQGAKERRAFHDPYMRANTMRDNGRITLESDASGIYIFPIFRIVTDIAADFV